MADIPNVIELTRLLVQQKTIDGNESACTQILAGMCEDAGFKIREQEFAPGRKNLIAWLPSDKPSLCFAGHLDTVPLGTKLWTFDPFAGEIFEERLYGRGSSDMKSGVAAMTVAALRVARQKVKHSGIVLIFTGGEETGCIGATRLQNLKSLVGEVGALLVPEPTSNYPLVGHKGVLWLEAVTSGKTAHGSMPEQGDNAIYKAARAVSTLEGFQFQGREHPVIGKATLNVGTISGGLNINSVPDKARLEIDIRTTPEQSHETIFQNVTRVLSDDVSLSKIMDLPPVWTDPVNPWIQEVFKVTSDILECQPEPRSVSYFTDASPLVTALEFPPALIMGPGEAILAHQTDEYCAIHRIEQAVELYEKICAQWTEK